MPSITLKPYKGRTHYEFSLIGFDSYDLSVFGVFYNLNNALAGYTYTLALLVLTLEILEG